MSAADPVELRMHELVDQLRRAGCVFAEDEARVLMSSASSEEELASLTARRCAGEPLEYVVGWAAFGPLRIHVDEGVFIPRRRTEFLATQAVSATPPTGVLLDLCCGAGPLAAAVRAARPDVEVHAADIDPRALVCARRNLVDCHVYCGDLFSPLPPTLLGRIDVIVANVPYVPHQQIGLLPGEARDHEPHTTLDGGPDGLAVAERVIAHAGEWLAGRGRLLFEISEQQADRAVRLLTAAGFTARIVADEELGATVAIGIGGDDRS